MLVFSDFAGESEALVKGAEQQVMLRITFSVCEVPGLIFEGLEQLISVFVQTSNQPALLI
jgi:hypothetical protein